MISSTFPHSLTATTLWLCKLRMSGLFTWSLNTASPRIAHTWLWLRVSSIAPKLLGPITCLSSAIGRLPKRVEVSRPFFYYYSSAVIALVTALKVLRRPPPHLRALHNHSQGLRESPFVTWLVFPNGATAAFCSAIISCPSSGIFRRYRAPIGHGRSQEF